ncbi:tyrosine-type recombinase/integrase [Altericroceibacterium xinjiangense]|uniref:tyrosine-type recombinase/integrase n=1 Tax=Altericroceibacterium xinjiangense TaxID=762261 RepID=UPI000F7D6AED|nr:integrase arm-type DNA-binding domain-containing protein [Altericroceibacterium xinjiangense]
MALTDTAIRNAKPREKPYKMGDAGGLFLLVQPSGGKLWRFKYRIDGREKKLAIGTYPDVSLADARKRRDDAREALAVGKDPSREKQREKARATTQAANTFELIAREYFDKRRRDGERPWADRTLTKAEFLLDQVRDIWPLPIGDIEPADVLSAVRKVEMRGNLESARRALQMTGSVMRYAVATARLGSDPTRDLRGALTAPRTQHRAAILNPIQLGALLRAIDGYDGHVHTRLALALAPHVFVRPGELREAQWEEFDFDKAVWAIPAAKTKMRKAHHVPLSRQAVAILTQARELTSRATGYVFPSIRTAARPMSENTLNAALRRLGYTKDEATAHGFRATASTLLNESGKWSADAIERALAHGDEDKIRGAYHRGQHWQERVRMAQWWSDYLDQLRDGAEIVPFPEREAG